MANVQVCKVSKSFGATRVLHDISLSIDTGEFVSLLGPSGSGKSTLLRIIAGLESVDEGRVLIGGEDVTAQPPEARRLAMMFQSYALLPHLSVLENVRFPLRVQHSGGLREQRRRALEALARVKLDGLARRRPRELSGGQQQRVALARAIVASPRVLLLDEPLSNLDAGLREQLQIELVELQRELELTTIFVTHDQREALSLSDRVMLMHGGRIEHEASPELLYARPVSAFSARFIGAANVLAVQIEEEGGQLRARLEGSAALPLPATVQKRGPALLVFRQEQVHMLSLGDTALHAPALEGRVAARIFLGSQCRYLVDVGDERIQVLAPVEQQFRRGDPVRLQISAPDLQILDADS